MTTTHDVPMPEPVASAYRACMKNAPHFSWCVYPGKAIDDDEWANLYTADQVRDTAIKYADARCAKLQAEVEAARRTGEYWKANSNAANAEIDALAEKVKAMEDDARRLDWIDQMVNKHSAVWLLTSGENQFVQIRSSVFDFGVKNHPTVSGGVRAAIDAATGEE